MTRAECYYDILGVQPTASGDDIKKAYRNLALIWHPDKNPNCDEAHSRFQSILRAYETLSDTRERDWYDRHKDQILSDGQAPDELLNVFQYFSSSVYTSFNDDDDGFFTVYRKVFETLASEEREAAQRLAQSKENKSKGSSKSMQEPDFPTFGTSESDYHEVVAPFYAFWSAFCTKITFDHLDKYKTIEAENRRMMRAMEKENKKVKDAARKERNQNVRSLVEFIKKRDIRLKLHRIKVEQQNELNRKKTAEKQRIQRKKVQSEMIGEYKPTAFEDIDDLEDRLRELETELDNEEDNYSKKGRRRRGRKEAFLVHEQDQDSNDP